MPAGSGGENAGVSLNSSVQLSARETKVLPFARNTPRLADAFKSRGTCVMAFIGPAPQMRFAYPMQLMTAGGHSQYEAAKDGYGVW